MAKINPHFQNIEQNYLFSEVGRRVKAFSEVNPGVDLLKLGVGNTTEPLVPSVVEGLKSAVEKLSKRETYTGYGDEQGSSALRAAIAEWYATRGISIEPDEVYVSDGAKSDCSAIASLCSPESIIAVSDPVYPVYRDSNLMMGRRVVYMDATSERGFIPALPKEHADLIFLCSPNNPTGSVMNREQLQTFVDYARREKAVIVFDAAYSEYIRDPKLPKSIFEIDGARECAIEIQSLSKSAGFTGVRLGWSVVPKTLGIENAEPGVLNQMWNRRQTTMFNGASNISQEGALAVLSPQGQKETHDQVAFYMENARIIREGLASGGLKTFGGVHAPYIWLSCPRELSSWDFFDELLQKAHVITTPGGGFGKNGEGYLRLSAFGWRANIERAVRSILENIKA